MDFPEFTPQNFIVPEISHILKVRMLIYYLKQFIIGSTFGYEIYDYYYSYRCLGLV
jgi:hypothetical protein